MFDLKEKEGAAADRVLDESVTSPEDQGNDVTKNPSPIEETQQLAEEQTVMSNVENNDVTADQDATKAAPLPKIPDPPVSGTLDLVQLQGVYGENVGVSGYKLMAAKAQMIMPSELPALTFFRNCSNIKADVNALLEEGKQLLLSDVANYNSLMSVFSYQGAEWQIHLGKILLTVKALVRKSGQIWGAWAATNLPFVGDRTREKMMRLARRKDCWRYSILGPERCDVLCAAIPVSTDGKGQHIYMRHPGFHVNNQVNTNAHIDVRGDGGYVAAQYDVVLLSRVLDNTEEFILPSSFTVNWDDFSLSQEGKSLICSLENIAIGLNRVMKSNGKLIVMDSWSDDRILLVGKSFENRELYINLELFEYRRISIKYSCIVFSKSSNAGPLQDIPLALATMITFDQCAIRLNETAAQPLKKLFDGNQPLMEFEYYASENDTSCREEIFEKYGLGMIYRVNSKGVRIAFIFSAVDIPAQIEGYRQLEEEIKSNKKNRIVQSLTVR